MYQSVGGQFVLFHMFTLVFDETRTSLPCLAEDSGHASPRVCLTSFSVAVTEYLRLYNLQRMEFILIILEAEKPNIKGEAYDSGLLSVASYGT